MQSGKFKFFVRHHVVTVITCSLTWIGAQHVFCRSASAVFDATETKQRNIFHMIEMGILSYSLHMLGSGKEQICGKKISKSFSFEHDLSADLSKKILSRNFQWCSMELEIEFSKWLNYRFWRMFFFTDSPRRRLCFHKCVSVQLRGAGGGASPSHNTSIGPMSFPEEYPTSTIVLMVACLLMGYSTWTGWGYPLPGLDENIPSPHWDWMGVPHPHREQLCLDGLCCRWYASCGLPQEDFLVAANIQLFYDRSVWRISVR